MKEIRPCGQHPTVAQMSVNISGVVGSTQLESAAACAPCWGRALEKSTVGALLQVQRYNLVSVAPVDWATLRVTTA